MQAFPLTAPTGCSTKRRHSVATKLWPRHPPPVSTPNMSGMNASMAKSTPYQAQRPSQRFDVRAVAEGMEMTIARDQG